MKRVLFLFLLSAGLSFPAKQVIVLEQSTGPGGDQNIHYCFWVTPVAGRQIPAPGFVSAYRGASAAEQAALQQGLTVEQCGYSQYPATFTLAQIQSALQSAFSAANTNFQALVNPNAFYGTNWDGATWTAGAVVPGGLTKYQVGTSRGNGSTSTTVISGPAGETTQIYRILITCSASGTIQLKNGAANLVLLDCSTNPISMDESASGAPLFQIGTGNSFQFTTSATSVNATVVAWYQQF